MVDVPYQVVTPPSIQRNVQVVGGTNWDLSRSAVQTPVQQLADPVPALPENDVNWAKVPAEETLPVYLTADNIPKVAPVRMLFSNKKSGLSKQDVKTLRGLSTRKAYVVVGHAGVEEGSPLKLSWARAKGVASALRHSGHSVKVVKAFGAARPASLHDNAQNARVEVYAVAKQ